MNRIVRWFFEGLLVVFPLAATAYILYAAISWFNTHVDLGIPGLGILAVLGGITLVGFLFSVLLGDRVLEWFDRIILRIPVIKLIYSPLKDLIEALVGEKKKFNEPVMVELENGMALMGFVTRTDLNALGIEGRVTVYFPLSYSFTGHIMLVPAEKVRPLHVNSAETMKFIISGGITGFEPKTENPHS